MTAFSITSKFHNKPSHRLKYRPCHAHPTPYGLLQTDPQQNEISALCYMFSVTNFVTSLINFVNVKLRKHQVTWLHCEIEALSVFTAVKHFSPYIIQSKQCTCMCTNNDNDNDNFLFSTYNIK